MIDNSKSSAEGRRGYGSHHLCNRQKGARYAILASCRRNSAGSHLFQFEQGIEETVKWYLENQEWMDHITSGEYQKYYEEMYC